MQQQNKKQVRYLTNKYGNENDSNEDYDDREELNNDEDDQELDEDEQVNKLQVNLLNLSI